jgi:hypothetical protein
MFRWKDVARTSRSAADPMLAELVSAIDRAPIQDVQIRHDDIIFGDCDLGDGTIRLNLSAMRCVVAIHELIHRVRPTWSESSVRARTTRILASLDDDQIAALDARLLDAMEGPKGRRRRPASSD